MKWWQAILCWFNLCPKNLVAQGFSYIHDDITDEEYYLREYVMLYQCPRARCRKQKVCGRLKISDAFQEKYKVTIVKSRKSKQSLC